MAGTLTGYRFEFTFQRMDIFVTIQHLTSLIKTTSSITRFPFFCFSAAAGEIKQPLDWGSSGGLGVDDKD